MWNFPFIMLSTRKGLHLAIWSLDFSRVYFGSKFSLYPFLKEAPNTKSFLILKSFHSLKKKIDTLTFWNNLLFQDFQRKIIKFWSYFQWIKKAGHSAVCLLTKPETRWLLRKIAIDVNEGGHWFTIGTTERGSTSTMWCRCF